MKSGTLTCITTMALFAALAVPLRVAAQQSNRHQPRYKLVDLGTLGGPQSLVSAGVQVLNNQGIVVGCADTSTPDADYLISGLDVLLPPDPFIFHTSKWRNGTPTDLGALPGANSSCANWISGNGLIAGMSENGAIDPLTGLTEIRAVLWKDGRPMDLGTFGGSESLATAVNDRGQVTGLATNATPDLFSAFGWGTQAHAFLWQNGVMQDLGTLGGPDSWSMGINERGQVVGFSWTNSTPNPVTGAPTLDPFLWENGRMIDLGTLGGTLASGEFLINNRGQVMGQSNLAGDLIYHSFLWERGVLTDLGSLFGGNVESWWMNDDGDIVGSSQYPGGDPRYAFLWKKGVMTNLGTLYPQCTVGTGSTAYGINSQEQVVGGSWCDPSSASAFLWEKGGPMIDLNTLIPPNSALQLWLAAGINGRGEIAGLGNLTNGDTHAFLLIPCGEGDTSCGDTIAATQSIPAPATQPRTTTTPANPALRGGGMLDRFRGRRFPGLRIPSPPSGPKS